VGVAEKSEELVIRPKDLLQASALVVLVLAVQALILLQSSPRRLK
jgi:hypothetical protein